MLSERLLDDGVRPVELTEVYDFKDSNSDSEVEEYLLATTPVTLNLADEASEDDASSQVLHLQRVSALTLDKDFTTIDFLNDAHRHRWRNRLYKQKHINSRCGRLLIELDKLQGWFLVIIVGLFTATTSGMIHYSVDWLSTFKDGVCTHGYLVPHAQCCLETTLGEECIAWRSWSQIITGSSYEWVNFAIYIMTSVTFACTAGYLVASFGKKAAGGGVPQVKSILGGFIVKQVLGFWVLIVKVLGLILALGAGLTVGSQGPLIHIACCFGNVCSRLFSKYATNEGKKRELLSAAAAAGMAAGFGAPLGGVLFSLEALSTYFPQKTMWRSFACAIVATLTLKMLYRFENKIVQFQISYIHESHWWEFPVFIGLGLAGGLVGVLFLKLNLLLHSARRDYWRKYPISEIAVVALITSVVSKYSVFLKVTPVRLVSSLFEICDNLNPAESLTTSLCADDGIILHLVLVCLVKFALTIFTCGIRVPAGIFMPAIVIGALYGRAVGIFMVNLTEEYPSSWIFEDCSISASACTYAGVYAIVGAASVFAGFTRMTISLSVTMFELTGSIVYVIPIVIAVATSKWIADLLSGHGIYDLLISWNKYPYIPNSASISDLNLKAKDIMSTHIVTVSCYSETLSSLQYLLSQHSFGGFPIVMFKESSNELVGYISRADLHMAIEQAFLSSNEASSWDVCSFRAAIVQRSYSREVRQEMIIDMSHYVDSNPIVVSPDTPLDILLDMFRALGLRMVIVCDSASNRVLGIIKKKDISKFIGSSKQAEKLLKRKNQAQKPKLSFDSSPYTHLRSSSHSRPVFHPHSPRLSRHLSE